MEPNFKLHDLLYMIECAPSLYGNGCNKTCFSCKNRTCLHTNGKCLFGCIPGYKPDQFCRKTCDIGRYGQNCTRSCSGNCKNGNSRCSTVDGTCLDGCLDGYVKDKCDQKCAPSLYGHGCNKTCFSCKNLTCLHTNGMCLFGCIPGYIPDQLCRSTCHSGRYGQNCTRNCTNNCREEYKQCDHKTGICRLGCERGFEGKRCDKQCPPGKHDYNCSKQCHHCKNGTVCDFRNGFCPRGCNPGFDGSRCNQECNDGYFGDCSHVCHCKNNLPCSKTDGYCHNGCALGWGGYNCSIDLNLIQRLSQIRTSQSSTYFSYNSSNAVDGKDSYDVDHCNCCSVTYGSPPSWWRIDLGKKYLIGAIAVYGREDIGPTNKQLENATLYADNVTITVDSATKEFIYQIPIITNTTKFTISLDNATIARFFMIKHSMRILTVCEIKLYEKVCGRGTFGDGCGRQCHCLDKKSCNSVTGKCQTPDCLPGWRGRSCEEGCGYRKFGENCKFQCHCFQNGSCAKDSGICENHRCDPGWQLHNCSRDENVIQLLIDSVKTSMSTVAFNRTSELAIDGNIGPDPDQCQCCSETKNSKLSWWTVDFGQTLPVSSVIVYSRNKENEFPRLDGFQMSLSNNSIYNSSSFRSSSTAMFGKMYQILLPSILSRQIKIERPGVLAVCEVRVFKGECEVGTFGRACSQNCHCADNQPCAQVTGLCQTNACKTGWRGSACDKKCLPDTFGDECREKCYCEVGTCTSNYGICTGKCRRGYYGPHCNQVRSEMQDQEKREYNTDVVVVGAVCGSAAVVVVAVGVLIYKFRQKKRSASKNNYATPNVHDTPTESPDYDTLDNLNDIQEPSNNEYENERVTGF